MKRMLPVVLDLVCEYGTNDPAQLCRFLKISVKKVVIPDMPKGLSLCVFGHNVIYVNKRLDFNAQSIVIAHELGHAVLGHVQHRVFGFDVVPRKENPEKVGRQELEANKFAFLLIAHTCLRNNADMINGIREEKLLTTERVLELLDVFSGTACYIKQFYFASEV